VRSAVAVLVIVMVTGNSSDSNTSGTANSPSLSTRTSYWSSVDRKTFHNLATPAKAAATLMERSSHPDWRERRRRSWTLSSGQTAQDRVSLAGLVMAQTRGTYPMHGSAPCSRVSKAVSPLACVERLAQPVDQPEDAESMGSQLNGSYQNSGLSATASGVAITATQRATTTCRVRPSVHPER